MALLLGDIVYHATDLRAGNLKALTPQLTSPSTGNTSDVPAQCRRVVDYHSGSLVSDAAVDRAVAVCGVRDRVGSELEDRGTCDPLMDCSGVVDGGVGAGYCGVMPDGATVTVSVSSTLLPLTTCCERCDAGDGGGGAPAY